MLTHQQDAQRHRRKRPASQTARKPIAAKTQHANTKKGAEPGASPNFAPSLTKHLSASLIVRRLARRSRTSSHAARCANVVRHAREELGFRLVRGTTRAARFAALRGNAARSTTPRTRPWFPVPRSPRHSGARRRQRPKWRRRPRTNQFHCNKRCPFGVAQSARMKEIATYFGE